MKICSNGKMMEVGGGQTQDIYSLEEQVVGRWVNGKPIYKRTWYFTTGPTYRIWTAVGIVVADLDEMIEMNVSITTNAGVDVRLPSTDSTAFGTFIYNRVNGNGLEFYFYHPSGNDFKQCPGKATLLYTKTTDQPTIELPAALTAPPDQTLFTAASQSTATVTLDAGILNEEV